MEKTIKLTYAFMLMLVLNSYAQSAEPTHPAQQGKPIISYQSTYRVFDTVPPLLIYDGLNLYDINSLKNFDTRTIAFVETHRDSIKGQHEQKFHGVVEITTTEGTNEGLKYIKVITKNWIKKHPLAIFYLNGQALKDDREKLDKLLLLKPDGIEDIRTLDEVRGKQLLGIKGENGVIVINTR